MYMLVSVGRQLVCEVTGVAQSSHVPAGVMQVAASVNTHNQPQTYSDQYITGEGTYGVNKS